MQAIDAADVLAVLQPPWIPKHETARRLRLRIGQVMKWAIAQGYRSDDPAGDAVGAALPRVDARPVHQRALPWPRFVERMQPRPRSSRSSSWWCARCAPARRAARSGRRSTSTIRSGPFPPQALGPTAGTASRCRTAPSKCSGRLPRSSAASWCSPPRPRDARSRSPRSATWSAPPASTPCRTASVRRSVTGRRRAPGAVGRSRTARHRSIHGAFAPKVNCPPKRVRSTHRVQNPVARRSR